jgi:UDP-N-acetylmuramoylalanine--D-glutamate ligase
MTNDFSGKRVYVIGLGAKGTGRATAQVLARRGARVTVADMKAAPELAGEIAALPSSVTLEVGDRAYAGIEAADLVVISPGVPPEIEPLRRARARGIPVVAEIEVAYRLARAPIVAITGTKGKTTTTALLGRLLADPGREALVGGNIGVPLIALADRAEADDILVAEVSSFQLEMIDTFRPRVAAVLNFFPDHLDRHPDLDAYWRAKMRIFENQTPQDAAVLNLDQEALLPLRSGLRACLFGFSQRGAPEAAVSVRGGEIVAGDSAVCPVAAVRLRGRHNVDNALAALACMVALGVPTGRAASTLAEFQGVPNRLEEVGVVAGVTFINDSQATTPAAVEVALAAIEEPIILIAGGRPKVPDFGPLGALIARRVKALVTLGEAGPALATAARAAGLAAVTQAATLDEAVRAAFQQASPGEVALLSPACASFDMFRNMEHRGEVFRAAVQALKEAETASQAAPAQ